MTTITEVAENLKPGQRVKYGSRPCIILSVNELFTTKGQISFNVQVDAGTIKRKEGYIEKRPAHQSRLTFRRKTKVKLI